LKFDFVEYVKEEGYSGQWAWLSFGRIPGAEMVGWRNFSMLAQSSQGSFRANFCLIFKII
jgi:hypothetical protein